MKAETLMGVVWPAFLAACLMELLVFALVDPQDLQWFGHAFAWPRQAVYSLAFFVFWTVTGLSSSLTAVLVSKPGRSHGMASGKADGGSTGRSGNSGPV